MECWFSIKLTPSSHRNETHSHPNVAEKKCSFCFEQQLPTHF